MLELNPNCDGKRSKHYVFKYDRIWSCVLSTNGDHIGDPLYAFMAELGCEIPCECDYLYCRSRDREIKFRQHGNIINLYINDLSYGKTSLS